MTATDLSQKSTVLQEEYVQRRAGLWSQIFKARWAYVFVAPFFILFILFSLYPIAFSLILSLNDWTGLCPMTVVGFDNYARLLKDNVFWQSMLNGVIFFALYVPIMTFLALVLAVILNSKRVKGFRFFRLLIFLPYITNMAAAGFTFRLLLQTRDGFVNVVLNSLGIAAVPWLDSIQGARISVSLLLIR